VSDDPMTDKPEGPPREILSTKDAMAMLEVVHVDPDGKGQVGPCVRGQADGETIGEGKFWRTVNVRKLFDIRGVELSGATATEWGFGVVSVTDAGPVFFQTKEAV